MSISEKDFKLLEKANHGDLTFEEHCALMDRLKDPDFRKKYEEMMTGRFEKSFGAYLPLVIFIMLIIVGLILIIKNGH